MKKSEEILFRKVRDVSAIVWSGSIIILSVLEMYEAAWELVKAGAIAGSSSIIGFGLVKAIDFMTKREDQRQRSISSESNAGGAELAKTEDTDSESFTAQDIKNIYCLKNLVVMLTN